MFILLPYRRNKPQMYFCPFCRLPLEQPADRCPSCSADLVQHRRTGWFGVEGSVDAADSGSTGIAKSDASHILPDRGGAKNKPPTRVSPSGSKPKPKKAPASKSSESSDETALAFRPVYRPPTLLLCSLFDGSRDEGQWYEIRTAEFRIGRTIGDLDSPNDIQISNDAGISGQHAAIQLRVEGGRYRFYLRDLESRNGTFVRVSQAVLKLDHELLIGARRYSFHPGSAGASVADSNIDTPKATQGWQALSASNVTELMPKLVEVTPQGPDKVFPLAEGANILGTDESICDITITGDPFVSSRHARIRKDKKNRWVIENLNSLNGVWMRIDHMPLDTGGEFQIGEQRFKVRIP